MSADTPLTANSSTSTIVALQDRALMLAFARSFFAERNIMEVDCPLASAYASVDAHIDLVGLDDGRFLHSSPEYGMKRLLAQGSGDIYQLSHVFRKGEIGRKHNPEFMMAEWYRVGVTFQDILDDTLDFIRVFLGNLQSSVISYRDALIKYTDIDPAFATIQDLVDFIEKNAIPSYENARNDGKDALLNLILAHVIEPNLGKECLEVLAYYPASQAALARKRMLQGYHIAERFEVYFNGVELANGYHELADAFEQRARLEEANAQRIQLGKEALPIDERFLEALGSGFPDCCGVAVGFDRLMMLRQKKETIAEVIPFAWDLA